MSISLSVFVEKKVQSIWIPASENAYENDTDEKGNHQRREIPFDLYADHHNPDLYDILGHSTGSEHLQHIPGYVTPAFISRGLPEGVSPLIKGYYENYADLAYRVNWILLQELLEFRWEDHFAQYAAYVHAEQQRLFHPEKNFPENAWKDDWEIFHAMYVSDEETHNAHKEGNYFCDDLENVVKWEDVGKTWARVKWRKSYAELAGNWFLNEFIPSLKAYGPPDQVRIIYWFW